MGGMGMSMPVGDIVPEIVLLAGAVAVLLVALFTPRSLQWLTSWAALTVLTVAAAATFRQLGATQQLTFFDTWAVDGVATAGKLLIIVSAGLVAAMSWEWLRTDQRAGEYQSLLLFATLGGVILVAAADVLELTMGLLLSSATGYMLAGYHRNAKESAEAAMKYYLLGARASATFVFGVVILFGLAGSTTYPAIAEAVGAADVVGLVAAAALLTVGLAFKAGAVPAHAWVPDVADGAPVPSAMFLLVVPKIGGVIAIARISVVLFAGGVGWRPLVALLAAATMTLGNLAALWQDDVRRLLGWSAVSQTGYALMAPVALGRSDLAIPSLLLFLAAYAAATVAAFGVVAELRGLRDRADYAGLAKTRPWLLAALAIAFLSMVGIPPLAGFAGKLALFAATIDAGYAWLALLAVVNTVASLYYYVRVLGPAYFEPAPRPLAVLGQATAAVTTVATAAVVLVGIAAEPLLSGFMRATLLP